MIIKCLDTQKSLVQISIVNIFECVTWSSYTFIIYHIDDLGQDCDISITNALPKDTTVLY